MLTAILVVSIFFKCGTVYAFEIQQKQYQQQQSLSEQMQEIAATLTSKGDTLKRKNRVIEKKKFAEEIKKDRQAAAAEQRRRAAAAQIVEYANQFVGCPYVWGGNSLSNGCDCSHFVYNVLKDTGNYSGGYTTSRSWASLGSEVGSIEKAQAGDIIVYSGHVAIYDGNGKIIQAQSSSAGITNNRSAVSGGIIAIRRFI